MDLIWTSYLLSFKGTVNKCLIVFHNGGCLKTCEPVSSVASNIKDGTVSEDDNTEHREVETRERESPHKVEREHSEVLAHGEHIDDS